MPKATHCSWWQPSTTYKTATKSSSKTESGKSALLRGSVLPEPIYKRAVEHFGQEGAAELFYFVSLYSMISVTLNAFNVPAPE